MYYIYIPGEIMQVIDHKREKKTYFFSVGWPVLACTWLVVAGKPIPTGQGVCIVNLL